MYARLRRDLQSVRDRDPAARGTLEILLCYPGLHAVWGHYVAHFLWRHRWRHLARMVASFTHWATRIDIHPAAKLGPGLFIDHGTGVVIGETAEIGADVTSYHGVTLGGTSLAAGKRHPTIGDRVTIGAGAKVLGPIAVGHDSRIGANAVVVKPVPADSVVVGVPGQIVTRSKPHLAASPPDLDHGLLPDLFGAALSDLLERVEQLEKGEYARPPVPPSHQPDAGVWRGADFSI